MMGSKIGWLIAGMILVGVGAVILLHTMTDIFGPYPEDPTVATTDAGVLDFHGINADVMTILPAKPSAPGNAAEDYNSAAKLTVKYDAIKQIYASNTASATEVPAGAASKMEEIRLAFVAGAKKKKFNYAPTLTGGRYRAVPPWNFSRECVEPLNDASAMMSILATHHLSMNRLPEAIDAQTLAFAMGWHMMNERIRVHVLIAGVNIQRRAIQRMIKIYANSSSGDTDKIANLNTYLKETKILAKFLKKKETIIIKLNPNAGDIFNIIENDEGRAWRIEALLILGPFKYSQAHHPGNTLKIKKLMEKFSKSDDPFEKQAAQRAIDFDDTDARTNWNFEL